MNKAALYQYFTSDCCFKSMQKVFFEQDLDYVYIKEPVRQKLIQKIDIRKWKTEIDGMPEEEHEYTIVLPINSVYWCSCCNNILTIREKKEISKERFFKELKYQENRRKKVT